MLLELGGEMNDLLTHLSVHSFIHSKDSNCGFTMRQAYCASGLLCVRLTVRQAWYILQGAPHGKQCFTLSLRRYQTCRADDTSPQMLLMRKKKGQRDGRSGGTLRGEVCPQLGCPPAGTRVEGRQAWWRAREESLCAQAWKRADVESEQE